MAVSGVGGGQQKQQTCDCWSALVPLLVGQSGSGHAGACVGPEPRSQRRGGLGVDGQRWILPVLRPGQEPRKLPAGLRWKGDGGGENLHLCFSSSRLKVSDEKVMFYSSVGAKFFLKGKYFRGLNNNTRQPV